VRLSRDRYRLYLVTDRRFQTRELVEVVLEVAAGGATMVQLREKDLDTRELLELGAALLAHLRPLGVPLIVDDRVDVALALGADGVHLGRKDLPVGVARRIMGDKYVIGATASTPEEARASEAAGADYLGVGAIFPTATKRDHSPVIGFDGLAKVCRAVSIPCVAISGIARENAAHAIGAGAAGVAVVSAILAAPDVGRAARELRREIDRAIDEREDKRP